VVPVDEPVEGKPPTPEPVPSAPAVAKAPVKAPATPKPALHKPAPKVADAVPKSGQSGAWIVQVGSFSSNDNAKALRDKLRKQGYTSFVEAVKGQKGMVYRVRVGPELTRKSAEQLNQRLSKEADIKGLVQSYP
jgi:DedD protein